MVITGLWWKFSLSSENLLTEGKTISEVMGSRVILHCRNKSINKLIQLTWKMNDVTLFSFTPLKPLHVSPEALSLNIRMSESESQLHTLIIERAQKSHTGNYTCETNTAAGPEEQTWELIITGALPSPKIIRWDETGVIPVGTTKERGCKREQSECMNCALFIIHRVNTGETEWKSYTVLTP